jgi:epoxyqueuosine reductase QueG
MVMAFQSNFLLKASAIPLIEIPQYQEEEQGTPFLPISNSEQKEDASSQYINQVTVIDLSHEDHEGGKEVNEVLFLETNHFDAEVYEVNPSILLRQTTSLVSRQNSLSRKNSSTSMKVRNNQQDIEITERSWLDDGRKVTHAKKRKLKQTTLFEVMR